MSGMIEGGLTVSGMTACLVCPLCHALPIPHPGPLPRGRGRRRRLCHARRAAFCHACRAASVIPAGCQRESSVLFFCSFMRVGRHGEDVDSRLNMSGMTEGGLNASGMTAGDYQWRG